MTYNLKFTPTALKEWKQLNHYLPSQFKKKLRERLEEPHIRSCRLSGFKNHYKIKLRAGGYRLVYEVIDEETCVLVMAVGKRERNLVYKKAQERKK